MPTTDAVPTLTVAAYAATWCRQLRGTVREHTRSRYRWLLDHYVLPSLGGLVLAELTRRDVRACLAALGDRLAPLTIRAAHAVLHAMLNAAVDDELVAGNVSARLARRLHRPVRPRPALDVGQLELFLTTAAATAPAQYPLFVALAAGGLRVGEAIGLRAEDLDPAAPVVTVRRTIRHGARASLPKSGKTRAVRVTEAAAGILRAVPVGPSGWLFPGRKRQHPIGYTQVRTLTARIAVTAGLPPLTPKTFRRSFAAVMQQHGTPLAWIAQQLGHSKVATTEAFYTDGIAVPVPALLRGG